MDEPITADNAADAIDAYWASQETGSSESDQATPAAEPAVPSGDDQGATEQDSFTSIDPNSLPEELQPIYKSLQADYTRKTQEAAPFRKLAEKYGEAEAIEQAMEWVSGLRDPSNLVQLHSELSEYLQSQGLTKAEADEAAASHIAENEEEEYGFSDPSEQLRKELDELKSWKEQMEEERATAYVEADLARRESAIRKAHPEYDDDDITAIYQRAYAFGGDLDAAASAFETEKQRLLTRYATEKATVPSAASSPTPTGGAQRPEKFESWEDRHQYAKKLLSALENQGEFGS